jgi:NADPH:quinone reductase-like Zn-dependent oxidoreductase
MGFAAGSFASHVMAQDAAMKGIPDGLSYVEAATIPLAFLTAAYALDHLARLRPAERVLIHGAAGGVGLAAVQLAQQRGAQVLATAGSQQKRCLLHQLGAGHPLRDHQADLVDAVLRVTGGQGVHVLLSALAGAQMVDNLRSLRPFGRYLQVGCHDLDATVAPLPYRSNLSYFGIDMEAVLTHRMEVAGLLFKAVVKQFDAGLLRPLPCISVPVARAADGFRRLLRYRPIGKIVLTMATEPSGRRSSPADDVRAVEIAAE